MNMGDPQRPRSSVWSFGSLVKSLTTKSEEVLQAYQRDLEEFGIGLKKETVSAAVAVKELPISLESTAAVAQESLEAVGQTLEEFGSSVWRGTTELIGQVKEAVKKVDEDSGHSPKPGAVPVTSGRLYSRHEAQLNALQCDSSTYCDEPEDQEDYTSWKATFKLDDRQGEIQSTLEENPFIQELHARIVPADINNQTFWTRYFYHLKKLQQAEDARADLVKRNAVEEDLSWEVDEDVGQAATSTSVPPVSTKEACAEDETKSDNSTSSDWLVVQEDKDSLNSESEQTPDQLLNSKSQASSSSANKIAEKEEDWGEWE